VRVKDESKEPVFTKPLHRGGTTVTRWGNISHEDLIGKRPRDIIPSKKGIELRVHVPTLEEYVVMTPRLVTPVSTMVSFRRRHNG
jgi:tRNA A58 N-methylase Trm61